MVMSTFIFWRPAGDERHGLDVKALHQPGEVVELDLVLRGRGQRDHVRRGEDVVAQLRERLASWAV